MAQESDPAAPPRDQMFTRKPPRRDIVGAHGDTAAVARNRSPAREMRPLAPKLFHPLAVLRVIAIAEQDQPIGAMAVLVLDMPIVLHPLERDQQVEPPVRAGARNRPEHREKEGIDHALVGGRVFEEQQCYRVRALATQRRRVLVDRVIEVAGNLFDPGARLGADCLVPAQRSADGRLRNPRGVSNVETGWSTRRLATHHASPVPGRPGYSPQLA